MKLNHAPVPCDCNIACNDSAVRAAAHFAKQRLSRLGQVLRMHVEPAPQSNPSAASSVVPPPAGADAAGGVPLAIAGCRQTNPPAPACCAPACAQPAATARRSRDEMTFRQVSAQVPNQATAAPQPVVLQGRASAAPPPGCLPDSCERQATPAGARTSDSEAPPGHRLAPLQTLHWRSRAAAKLLPPRHRSCYGGVQ